MPNVKLTDVTFSYPLYELTGRSLKVTMMRQVAGAKLILGQGHAKVEALCDVSFELKEGDRLGLIGHNGSGKSTLLRVIAGLAHPQEGEVDIEGRVIPLIDRGMGINPELSGLENIELPLRLLGATSAEVREAKQEIPEWTGLGPFLHLPYRTYSDGMKARLQFALSTAVRGDILVLDEWLGAGDAAFVEQATRRLDEFVSSSKIIVLASHSLDLVQSVCNVVCWLVRGQMIAFGPTEEIVPVYLQAMHEQAVAAE